MNPTPSPEDLAKAVEVLSRLQPGKIPLEIFIEIARLTVLPIIEVVPVRLGTDGKPQVLLTERDASDPIWGGMLHTPGTVLRPSDAGEGNTGAFGRILNDELNGVKVGEPVLVDSIFHKVKRGVEQAQVYYGEVYGEPTKGQFYDADSLPANVVDTQLDFIRNAVALFVANKQ